MQDFIRHAGFVRDAFGAQRDKGWEKSARQFFTGQGGEDRFVAQPGGVLTHDQIGAQVEVVSMRLRQAGNCDGSGGVVLVESSGNLPISCSRVSVLSCSLFNFNGLRFGGISVPIKYLGVGQIS